ncbi:MAG: DUF4292 domain-containing protein [Bacteroidota bacterium]
MNKIRLYIWQLTFCVLSAFLILFLHSCKTSRIDSKSFPHLTISKLLEANDTSYVNSDILDLRFKARYTDPEGSTQRATCYLRIYTDSLIWVSVRTMNLEGMRMLLTPDSLQFADRINKKYYQGSYEYFSKKLLIEPNFHIIQNLLLQKRFVFNPRAEKEMKKNLKPCKDSLYYCIKLDAEKPKGDHKKLKVFDPPWVKQYYRFYPHSCRLANIDLLSTLTGDKIRIAYSKTESDNQYPGEISINLTGQQDVTLEMENKKAEFGDSVKTPFKIPENYEPVRY